MPIWKIYLWKICSCRHMRNCHMENFSMYPHRLMHGKFSRWNISLCMHGKFQGKASCGKCKASCTDTCMENLPIYNAAHGYAYLENISACIRKIFPRIYIQLPTTNPIYCKRNFYIRKIQPTQAEHYKAKTS